MTLFIKYNMCLFIVVMPSLTIYNLTSHENERKTINYYYWASFQVIHFYSSLCTVYAAVTALWDKWRHSCCYSFKTRSDCSSWTLISLCLSASHYSWRVSECLFSFGRPLTYTVRSAPRLPQWWVESTRLRMEERRGVGEAVEEEEGLMDSVGRHIPEDVSPSSSDTLII